MQMATWEEASKDAQEYVAGNIKKQTDFEYLKYKGWIMEIENTKDKHFNLPVGKVVFDQTDNNFYMFIEGRLFKMSI